MALASIRIVGPGRAGQSFAQACEAVGLQVDLLAREAAVASAASDVDAVLIATPDRAIAQVAQAISPGDAVLLHCSGATGLAPLAGHPRHGSIHPLMALPSAEVGATRLRDHGWFAVAGDLAAAQIVDLFGGQSFVVDDDKRALYHATAAVSANHLVALLGQVERLADQVGVPVQAFLDLARGSFDDVVAHGAVAALTGPAARGDHATLEAHRVALPPSERALYDTLVVAAQHLADRSRGVRPCVTSGRRIERERRMTVQVTTTLAETWELLDAARAEGKTVGLAPTMGFLHAGHASLIQASAAENDVTLTTIFVNPLQFGADEDLSDYPRDLERDLKLCQESGATIVLTPSVDEMYPQPIVTTVTVNELSEAMEGAQRPTHFAGVATVVAKLFHIGGRCRAYFGEKDYQQLAVVRRMVSDLSFQVQVIGCPIVREENGLAMSSRNTYLSTEQFAAAAVLNRSLRSAVELVQAGERDADVVRSHIIDMIATEPLVSAPDYVAIVDADSLQSLMQLRGDVRIILAAQVGRPRLLDNIGVSLDR